MNLEAFVAEVEREAPDASVMDRIVAAVRVGGTASSAADDAVRYFVDIARREGHSWTEIGERLGVSKQAARKRFGWPVSVTKPSAQPEMRPRLVACLDASRREALADNVVEPGSQHLLLGLFSEGYAANLLDGLGATVEQARTTARQLFPSATSADSDDAVAAAMRFARECGHDYVGTEHLLYVLANDPGSPAGRVLERMGIGASVRRTLRCFDPDRRSVRWRRFRSAQSQCSFCGRRKDDAAMVAGPGVCICDHCVELAADVLAGRSTA